ncbi:hypothetical protein DFJ58DRAFT_721792 [Suillus subalutaceus]|uniref:uncharacterized protein n=1 Tax=Suillus subalutaceus TaxID=48586 RepID=UPI001B887236|nr:uncharacterized protein DFJ58DRAFT_721792 [Suillus subalutaceus]KAG1874804.1 hypothetical protein DFJ58DRAFT_721792 [Suillus subalutaceus]
MAADQRHESHIVKTIHSCLLLLAICCFVGILTQIDRLIWHMRYVQLRRGLATSSDVMTDSVRPAPLEGNKKGRKNVVNLPLNAGVDGKVSVSSNMDITPFIQVSAKLNTSKTSWTALYEDGSAALPQVPSLLWLQVIADAQESLCEASTRSRHVCKAASNWCSTLYL